jgi:hypothetical protein
MDECLPVYYSQAAVTDAMSEAGAGRAISVLQHNSLVATMSTLLDIIAAPKATIVPAGAVSYATADYWGPLKPAAKAGLSTAVYGSFAPPAAPDQLVWWESVALFLRQLGAGYTLAAPATSSTPAATSTATLILVTGPGADAVIPPTVPGNPTQLATGRVTEDRATMDLLPALYAGAWAYAGRLGALASGQTTTQSAAEIAGLPVAKALATNYDAQAKKAQTTFAVGAGLLFLGSMILARRKR